MNAVEKHQRPESELVSGGFDLEGIDIGQSLFTKSVMLCRSARPQKPPKSAIESRSPI